MSDDDVINARLDLPAVNEPTRITPGRVLASPPGAGTIGDVALVMLGVFGAGLFAVLLLSLFSRY